MIYIKREDRSLYLKVLKGSGIREKHMWLIAKRSAPFCGFDGNTQRSEVEVDVRIRSHFKRWSYTKVERRKGQKSRGAKE